MIKGLCKTHSRFAIFEREDSGNASEFQRMISLENIGGGFEVTHLLDRDIVQLSSRSRRTRRISRSTPVPREPSLAGTLGDMDGRATYSDFLLHSAMARPGRIQAPAKARSSELTLQANAPMAA
jgi:hypothetical protein